MKNEIKDILVEWLRRLLLPKSYNKFTLRTFYVGIALITKPLWLEILIHIFNLDFSVWLIGALEDSIFSFLIILVALIYNTVNFRNELKYKNKSNLDKNLFNKFLGKLPTDSSIIHHFDGFDFNSKFPINFITNLQQFHNDLTYYDSFKDKELNLKLSKFKESLYEFLELVQEASAPCDKNHNKIFKLGEFKYNSSEETENYRIKLEELCNKFITDYYEFYNVGKEKCL